MHSRAITYRLIQVSLSEKLQSERRYVPVSNFDMYPSHITQSRLVQSASLVHAISKIYLHMPHPCTLTSVLSETKQGLHSHICGVLELIYSVLQARVGMTLL